MQTDKLPSARNLEDIHLLGASRVFLEAIWALPGLKSLLGSFVVTLAPYFSVLGSTKLAPWIIGHPILAAG